MTQHCIPSDQASEATSEDDRRWFENHPDRVTRFRAITDGDLQDDGVNAIVVFCPVDGFRMRIAVECLPGTPAYEWLHGAAHGDTDLLPIALEGVTGTMGEAFASCCTDALYAFAKTGRRLPDFPQRGHA